MRIALAQLNQTVGDFDGNTRRIIEAARAAEAQGAQILLTPELSLTGYPPEDLLLRRAFYDAADAALLTLRQACAQLSVDLLVGLPLMQGDRRYNAAVLLRGGEVVGEYRKHDLPNYDVFDEERYFESDDRAFVFDAGGIRCGVVICEDFWSAAAPAAAHAAGAQVLLALNASPYHLNKHHERADVARRNVSSLGLPILAANMVGGQDELVFDGLSFALDSRGEMRAQAKAFEPDLLLVDLEADEPVARVLPGRVEPSPANEQEVYGALVLGVRDYVDKNGFPGVIIGLSGGIDSALTLAIAVDALGADRVRTVMMPSRYTAEISWTDAADMAHRLGVRYDELPISPVFEAFGRTLAAEFAGLPEDTTEENIQARIRGTLLMALSNKYGSIVLTTGNKSEMAVGYCTLYGDMAGGFAVIKDISKTLVWRLCRWRNTVSDIIPERIITRPPSAELKADQTDQDSLPAYDILDGIMQMYMEDNRSVVEIIAAGYPREAVEQVVRLMRINEYKRRQAPIGIRVTHRAFGRDWRQPITSKFRE
ncbi:MAG: NAD+ synthase [Burkholderiaceae bacterium]|nr:NAD+ synthase [Burkholderiaceae bacterium]